MRHKTRLLNLILIVVFIFSFAGCTKNVANEATATTAIPTTQTTIVETTIPLTTITETTVMVTETTIDESKDYITQITTIESKLLESMGTFGQSMTDKISGKISLSKNKEDAANFIKDINVCYDIFLSLKVPEKFNAPHELMKKAMDHLINSNIYLQQYIDTENISDVEDSLIKATSEINLSMEYNSKANEQYNSLK